MGRTKQELLTEMDRRRATLCEGGAPGIIYRHVCGSCLRLRLRLWRGKPRGTGAITEMWRDLYDAAGGGMGLA
jgi:hypothetical protein